MVKDKVIEMENGHNYYILEEVEYNNKKYVLSLECDLENDKIDKENYYVMEFSIVNNDIVVKNIEDDEVAKIVASMLFDKIKK